MILLSALPRLFIVLLSLVVSSKSQEDETTVEAHDNETEVEVRFTNLMEHKVEINWYDNPSEEFVRANTILPGSGVIMTSGIGHTFSYDMEGTTHTFTVQDHNSNVVIGPDHFFVKCSTTEGDIHLNVIPQWSPLGAARFIDLVRIGYFNQCALNRVVKKFLTQFGISSDFEARTHLRQATIHDDAPPLVDGNVMPFQPGYLSYAGSGPDSRTSEIFMVMPDAEEHQVKAFGTNPWETPFGFVEPVDFHVMDKWYSYGDIAPFGDGPDPQKIYEEDGYEYLRREFPAMSYIHNCEIISPARDDVGEEL